MGKKTFFHCSAGVRFHAPKHASTERSHDADVADTVTSKSRNFTADKLERSTRVLLSWDKHTGRQYLKENGKKDLLKEGYFHFFLCSYDFTLK